MLHSGQRGANMKEIKITDIKGFQGGQAENQEAGTG